MNWFGHEMHPAIGLRLSMSGVSERERRDERDEDDEDSSVHVQTSVHEGDSFGILGSITSWAPGRIPVDRRASLVA